MIVCESRSRYLVVVVVVVVGGSVSGAGRSQATPCSACYNQVAPEVCCNKTPLQITVQVATKYCG